MKKTKKMLSFVLSMLLIVTMFPTMAFAKEEAKTWKFGELSLKAVSYTHLTLPTN